MIGVGGCVASQEGEEIVRRAPFVDVVFGPQTLHRLPELLAQRRGTGRAQVDISFPEIEKFDHLPPARVDGASAFVSIMEGCSKYCSFCVVPYTRGEEVSRPFEDVLAEVRDLAAKGVKEVTLLGQNVNAYLGEMADGESADFALLLAHVARIAGLERLRYTTSHPLEFSQRLIDAYGKIPKLVSQVHLPVQSGSDRVLAAMKRNYTAMEYKSIIRRLRAVRPDISISSDFIVGFPGETEEDFAQTMKLVEDVRFDGSFSFLYSARPGTPAANLADAHAAGGETGAPAAPAEAPAGVLRGVLARHGRHPPARAGRGSVAEGPERARRAHRQQPRRELSGQRAARRPLCRGGDRAGAAAQPAGRRGPCARLRGAQGQAPLQWGCPSSPLVSGRRSLENQDPGSRASRPSTTLASRC